MKNVNNSGNSQRFLDYGSRFRGKKITYRLGGEPEEKKKGRPRALKNADGNKLRRKFDKGEGK